MGKIKQGILGGFIGKVGTVVGSVWNGTFYIKALPETSTKGPSSSQKRQSGYFKELVALSKQLTKEELAFIYPRQPKGMSRRNLFVKQLSALAVVFDDTKNLDLDSFCTLGNAPVTDLPVVKVIANGTKLRISWEDVTYYRDQHPDEYPVIFVANVKQKSLFLVGSPEALKSTGEQSFEVDLKPFGAESDRFSGFMLATGQNQPFGGVDTSGVSHRPSPPS